MKIEKHISELLYDHDCVIITDFGGFVANYKGAFVKPAHHIFSPPCKKIAFNASLKNNDGLLANYVAQKSSMTYSEACNYIDAFVEDCFSVLNRGKKLKIENVGVLFYDPEKNLQFIADENENYLLDSFGLSNVHSPAIRRDQQSITRREKSVVTSSEKTKFPVHLRIIDMISIAAFVVLLIFSPVIINRIKYISFVNLNPFDNKPETVTTKIPETKISNLVIVPKSSEEQAAAKNDSSPPTASRAEILPPETKNETVNTETNNSVSSNERAPVEASRPEIKVEPLSEKKAESKIKPSVKPENVEPEKKISTDVVRVKPEVTISTEHAKYFIIVGCFSIDVNAAKFVKQLKAKGYPASNIGLNAKGMHMVSVSPADDVYKATETLDFYKSKDFHDAWIFRKN